MQYKLTITKLIDNPNYEAEMVDYDKQRNNSYGISSLPSKTIEDNSFLAILTEKEFQAVKKAVIEIM